MARSSPRAGAGANQVRIIGGQHRGRKLSFPDIAGLRPTTDRVRETLFNWLQPVIQGAYCLDLFAGSGAFGIESLSRGARFVHFVDNDPRAVKQLRDNLEQLELSARSKVTKADGLNYLHDINQKFDLVFLDPPFDSSVDDLLLNSCQELIARECLSENALVYLEQDSRQPWPALPAGWRIHREGKAGQSAFRLMKPGNVAA